MEQRGLEALQERLNEVKGKKEKIALLYEISDVVRISDPPEASRLVRKGIRLSRAIGDKRWLAEGLLRVYYYYLMQADEAMALSCLAEAETLLDGIPQKLGIHAGVYRNMGCVYLARGDYRTALEHLERALEAAEDFGPRHHIAPILGPMADAYRHIGDYPKALDLLTRVYRVAEADERVEYALQSLHNMGLVYTNMGDLEKGLEVHKECLERARAVGHVLLEAIALGEIAAIYIRIGEIESALEYLQSGLEMQQSLGARYNVAAMIGLRADIHARRGEFPEALNYARESLKIYTSEVNDKEGYAGALLKLGEIHQGMGNLQPALESFIRARDVAEEIGHGEHIRDAHRAMAEIYEALEDSRCALEHYKMYMKLTEELHGQKAQRAVAAAQMRAEIDIARRDREIYRLKSLQLEYEVETKTQKLTAMALQLAHHSELITRLEDTLRPLIGRPNHDGADPVTAAMRYIRENANGTIRWETFEGQFRQVHPGFVQTLSQRYGALTPMELRVCSLMKINLSTKEIAGVLCASVRTVENHRRHIRTKLGLARDENLETFLAAIQ